MTLFGLFLIFLTTFTRLEAHQYVNITVPESFKVEGEDAYVCTVVELPPKPQKLVAVTPLAEKNVVHHILLFGCRVPLKMPTAEGVAWDCMHKPTCQDGGTHIIYGWGSNAPEHEMPPGVAFSVGQGTAIRYIVAQVHYLKPRPPGDRSGVQLTLHGAATPHAAGVLAYAAGFAIPPNTPSTLVDNECCYQGHQHLTTFAFRVHTHELGRAVRMTRRPWNRSMGVEVMATNDPQLPQAFYPVKRQVILPGDRLKVTCDFDSRGRDTITYAGATHGDEMCNLYMMVFSHHPIISMCGGAGFEAGEDAPGMLPSRAAFVADPCPFWKPPASMGDVTGVAVAGNGELWALVRGSRHWKADTFVAGSNTMRDKAPVPEPVVVRLDEQTGEVLGKLGGGLFSLPHMLTVDPQGNLWVVDVGAHQVVKMDPSGRVLLRVGEAHAPGSTHTRFCQPTQVAVARDGSFFVSDGYCNSRVVWFDAQGKFIAEAAMPRMANGAHAVAHSVVLDECKSRVWVAAREAGAVHEFAFTSSQAGSGVLELKGSVDLAQHGRAWALQVGPYGAVMALTWEEGKDAALVNVRQPFIRWVIPGLASLYPHDIALGAAPTALSGASDRMYALYVAPTCGPPGCGPLRRFVFKPEDAQFPPVSELVVSSDVGVGASPQSHSQPSQGSSSASKHPAQQSTPATHPARGSQPNRTTTTTRTPHASHTVSRPASGPAGAHLPPAANSPRDAGSSSKAGDEESDEETLGPYDMFQDIPIMVDDKPGTVFARVVGPRSVGPGNGRVMAALLLAGCMVGAAVVVGLKLMRMAYPDRQNQPSSLFSSSPAHNSSGKGSGSLLLARLTGRQSYKAVAQPAPNPSIDDMLKESAALEGLEEGEGALGGVDGHGAGARA